MRDIFAKAEELKRKNREKINNDLRDRIAYETKDTLKSIERLRSRGKTDRDIMRDLERSVNKKTDD